MIKVKKAKKIREGDFLVDLDYGYVYTDPVVSEYRTEISFHDSEGEECTLEVSNEFPLKIKRGL